MHFSKDDLRAALKRKDPGPDFTRRVMARVSQVEKKLPVRQEQEQEKDRRDLLAWLTPFRMRFAMAGAMAALILIAATWLGYQQYQRNLEAKRQKEVQEQIMARQAGEEAIRALRITSAKLNHVFQKVNTALPGEAKIRRPSL